MLASFSVAYSVHYFIPVRYLFENIIYLIFNLDLQIVFFLVHFSHVLFHFPFFF
jgi:hypothetical protein